MLASPVLKADTAACAEAAVLVILEAIAAGHRARDAAALARLYAPDARLADLAPPLMRRGFDAARHQASFDGWDGRVEIEFRDLAVAASGGLALVDGLMRTARWRRGRLVVAADRGAHARPGGLAHRARAALDAVPHGRQPPRRPRPHPRSR